MTINEKLERLHHILQFLVTMHSYFRGFEQDGHTLMGQWFYWVLIHNQHPTSKQRST